MKMITLSKFSVYLKIKKMETTSFLKKFFAVTTTALYKVVIDKRLSNPEIVKMEFKGKGKSKEGYRINKHRMVAVCKRLITFNPLGSNFVSQKRFEEKQISNIHTLQWGEQTSEIIALFLEEKDARTCYNLVIVKQKNDIDKWRQDTIEVLRAIGENHPHCSIEVLSPILWLIPPREWRTN